MNRYLIIWDTQANGNQYFMRELLEVKISGKRNTKLIEMIKDGIRGVRLIRMDEYERLQTLLNELDYCDYYVFRSKRWL